MPKNDFVPRIPYGTRDFLPPDAARKRQLETSAAELFARWGYQEVVTPTFEYLEIFGDSALSEQSFKFFDRQAQALILRPDMTSPIARLAATRLRTAAKPQRLFYIANLFRYEDAQTGRQCEFYQAGVELFGASSVAADAEVVALAAETLKNTGLSNFKISLGHVGFLNGVVESGSLPTQTKDRLKSLLSRRDLAGLEAYAQEKRLGTALRSCLREVLFLHGGQEVLDKSAQLADNPLSRQALANLAEIFALLQSHGVADLVDFDLGLIRDFDYYTGMVFEAYTPGLGFPICGGGRYDNMLSALGEPCPAVGFAAGVERLLLALAQRVPDRALPDTVYIGWPEGRLAQALQSARQFRGAGRRVELALTPSSAAEAALQAQGRELIYIEG